MKILMTADTYLPRIGGGQYHVHYLVRELRKHGADITLYVTEAGTCDDDEEGFVHRRVYKGPFSLFRVFWDIWRLSKENDLIHAHYSYRVAFISAIVAKLRRKPFVLTQHGLGLLPQAGVKGFYEWAFRVWRFWSMKGAHKIISTSEDLSLDIKKLGFGKKIVSISNGYDADFFHSGKQENRRRHTLLTTRRLVAKTGIQYLVAALPFVREKVPDCRYICIGDGRLKEDIVALAKELDVFDMISFEGMASHNELVSQLQSADIVVFPSTAESTSLSCIEAMGTMCTIVSSRVGGLVELLGEDEERGYLSDFVGQEHCNYDAPFRMPEDRIRMLADRIIYAFEHEKESKIKAAKAAAYAKEHYSWSVIADKTESEVYEKL